MYSPRWGTTYLVGPSQASGLFPRLLGLPAGGFVSELGDPVQTLALTGAFEKEGDQTALALPTPDPALGDLYLKLHRRRDVYPPNRAVRLIRAEARRRPAARSVEEIGALVWAVERMVGDSDCYPRALLTAHLCLAAGLACDLVIGILAPTSKLHAWCSVDGVAPFEPLPRHWWFQPLMVGHVR